jgi:hypothetical protein
MPREKSNRGNSHGINDKSNHRGGGQNVSSRRGSNSMEDNTPIRKSTKGGRLSQNDLRRRSEDSDRSE